MTSLFEFDLSVFKAIHLGWHSPAANSIFLILSYLGLGQVQVALALISRIWIKNLVWPLVLSVVLTGIGFADLLKMLIPRDRPSKLAIALPQEPHRLSSFPSGHTTTAFAVAVTILLFAETPAQKRFGWCALVVAFGVGLSRIYRGVHWPTDVFAGACAGTFGACLIYLIWSKRVESKTVEI